MLFRSNTSAADPPADSGFGLEVFNAAGTRVFQASKTHGVIMREHPMDHVAIAIKGVETHELGVTAHRYDTFFSVGRYFCVIPDL